MKRITLLALLSLPLLAHSETFTVTAYCHCAACCGRAGQPAANGKMPRVGITVAGPRRFPLGTRILIQGVGERVIQDRLARRYDNRIDIFMADHKSARQFGIQNLNVTILK